MFQTTNISGKQDLSFEQAVDHVAKEEENAHCWRDPEEATCPDRAGLQISAGEGREGVPQKSPIKSRTAYVSPSVLRGVTVTELCGNITSF